MIVRVAAGVLQRADGSVLIAQRPGGKTAEGRWEFPGGKIEPGESAQHALSRELREEIGIEVEQCRPLIRLRHAYPERTVELDTWLVPAWRGEPRGLEDQALAWVRPEKVWDYDLLEADAPIIDALRLPSELPVTGDFSSEAELWQKLQAHVQAGHCLIRLRANALDDNAYAALARRMAAKLMSYLSHDQAADVGRVGMLVDRVCVDQTWPGIGGLHLRSRDLAKYSTRPVAPNQWLFASVHSESDIARAQGLQANALVLGSVQPTPSHPQGSTLSWDGFASLANTANVPVYAIGGLGRSHLSMAIDHGAQGVAAIRAYWCSSQLSV